MFRYAAGSGAGALLVSLALSAAAAAEPRAYGASRVGTVDVIATASNAVTGTILTPGGDMAISRDGSRLYVLGSRKLQALDTATKQVVGTLAFTNFDVIERIELSPDGTLAYLTDVWVGALVAVDTATLSVRGMIDLDHTPNDVVFAPDGTRAYVLCDFGGLSTAGDIAVVDTASDTVVAHIAVPPPASLVAAVASADGGTLYVAEHIGGSLIVVDLQSGQVSSRIQVNGNPTAVTLAPDGGTAYVAGNVSPRLAAVDLSAGSVAATAELAYRPGRISLSADGTALYVTQPDGCSVAVVATEGLTVTASIDVDDGPLAIALAPPPLAPTPMPTPRPTPVPTPLDAAQACAYVTHPTFDLVSIIDTHTQALVGSLSVPRQPLRVAITPDGTRAYVSSLINGEATGALSVIDTATNHVAGHVILGSSPAPLALSPDGASAYVGTVDSCYQLLDVDLEASAIRRRIRGPATGDSTAASLFPVTADVAISPDGGTVYVARQFDQVVAAIDAATGDTLAEIPFAKTPTRLALTPDGRFLYVVLPDEFVVKPSFVAVVDTATYSVVTNIEVDNPTGGIAMRPDGRFLYVAHADTAPFPGIAVIDTATNQVTASIPDLAPSSMAFTPDGTFLYGVDPCSNDSCTQSGVSVIDAGTNVVVGSVLVPGGARRITIGTVPYGCVAPAGGPCVGDCNGDGQVSVDELVTGVNITLGVLPEWMCPAFDPGGDASVTIDDLVHGVDKAVNGCGG